MRIDRIIEYYIFFQLVSGTLTGSYTSTSNSSVRPSSASALPGTTPYYGHTTVYNTSDTGDTSNVTSAITQTSYTTSGIVPGLHEDEYTDISAPIEEYADNTVSSEMSVLASTVETTMKATATASSITESTTAIMASKKSLTSTTTPISTKSLTNTTMSTKTAASTPPTAPKNTMISKTPTIATNTTTLKTPTVLTNATTSTPPKAPKNSRTPTTFTNLTTTPSTSTSSTALTNPMTSSTGYYITESDTLASTEVNTDHTTSSETSDATSAVGSIYPPTNMPYSNTDASESTELSTDYTTSSETSDASSTVETSKTTIITKSSTTTTSRISNNKTTTSMIWVDTVTPTTLYPINETVTISEMAMEANEGETTQLTCTVIPRTDDMITWSLDGMTLYNTTRRYILQDCTEDNCTSALYITNISDAYDEGNYSCAVNNQSSAMSTLTVYQNPIVTISPQLASIIRMTERIDIICNISNCDEINKATVGNFVWCPSYHSFSRDDCFSIISTKVYDYGNSTISCGIQECTQNATVYAHDKVSIGGQTWRAYEGEDIFIECSVLPPSNDNITWRLNGTVIVNSTRYSSESQLLGGRAFYRLFISDVIDIYDVGNYSCEVHNQTSEMFPLSVYARPNVTISPQWSSVLNGSYVNITCSIINCEEDDVWWERDRIKWCPQEMTTVASDKCSSVISTLATETLTISCGFGDTCTQSTSVHVYNIVTISGMVTETNAGETVELVCTVTPRTDDMITWSLDDVTIYNITRRYILQDCNEDNCTSTLYLTDISDSLDDGNYSCALGNQSSEMYALTVYQYPNVSISPQWSSVLLGSTVNITCSIDNCDEINQTAMGNLTWCSPDLSFTILNYNTCTMEISAVVTDLNNSTISCGIQECSENLTINAYEIVKISGMVTETYEGEAIRLLCTVTPRTDDNITWSLDGVTLHNTTRRYILQDCTEDNCTSTLYITNIIDVIDEGNYSCSINNQSSKIYALTVYQIPNITITPSVSAMLLGTSANITCHVNNCDEIDKAIAGNFTWCPPDTAYTIRRRDSCMMEISTVPQNMNISTISCGLQECSGNATTLLPYVIVTMSGTDTSVHEGETTQMKCTVIPVTDDPITWSLNGVTLQNTTRRYSLQTCHGGSCASTLYITHVSDMDDEGIYRCNVNYQPSKAHNLTVYQHPKVTISPQWSSVLLGSSVNVICSINNCGEIGMISAENFTWCPHDLEFTVLRNDTCEMEISTVMANLNNSTISCGTQQCSQNMTVMTYELVTLSGTVTGTYEGETTRLMCTVTPRTDDIITWSLDGVTIHNTSRRYILQDCTEDNCTSTLYITDISDKYDEGNYSCAVYNQTSSNYALTVYQNPDITISPLWSSVLLGSSVNITCSINNCNKINKMTMGNFTWCPSDLVFSIVNTDTCSMEISINVTDLNNSTISCGIRKCSQNTTVNAFELVPSYSLSISANTSSPDEGEAVRLTCSVTPRTDSISWTQDGITLSNSTRRNFTQKCSGTTCTSKLYLQNILAMTDKGNYSCKVNNQSSEVYMLTVYQKPTITIRPEPTPVMINETLNVTCSISNCDKIDKRVVGNFTWRTNDSSGLPYTTIQNSTYKMKISVKVTSVKPPGANSYKISCSIGTYSASSTINVYTPAPNACTTKKENDITWYKTNAETTVTQDCPEGYVGKATRRCNNQGQWESADISDCESEKLHEVTQTLQKLEKTKIDAAGLNSVLTSVHNFVTADLSDGGGTDKADLQANNVVKTAEILKNISSATFDIKDAKQANETAQNFVGIAANLLNNNKTEKLKRKSQKKDTATNLIKSIDNLGKKLSENIRENETISITKSNIVVLIQKVKPKKVEFPDPEKSDKLSEDTTKLTLDEETLKKLAKTQDGITFTAVKYTSLGSLLDSFSGTKKSTNITVNSDILSLSIHCVDTSVLDPPVNFVFQNSQRSPSGHTLNCSFLNLSTSEWSSEGCTKIKSDNENKTNCSCTHLTNFAILMSPGDSLSEEEYERLRFISLVGCSLSIAGGVLTIAVYLHFWRYVKSRRSVLVVNLCFAMSSAYLVFLVAVERNENKVACIAIAALLHYLFLSMFCLMLSIGIDLAIAILHVYKSRSKSASLLLLGWGVPVVIVGVTMASTQLKDYGDDRFCWLRNDTLYGFIVPVLAIITINILIVIAVMRRMYSTSIMLKKSKKQKAISGVRSMAALLPVLGLTWVFGVLSVASEYVIFQYLFSIFNSIQGLFVFIFHCVFNISIRKAFRNSVRKFDLRNNSSFQKTSKEKLTSKSSNEFKGHSDEMADADLNLNQDPSKSVYAIPRSKIVIGNRHRPREDRGNFSRFSDNSSFYSQRNTHL